MKKLNENRPPEVATRMRHTLFPAKSVTNIGTWNVRSLYKTGGLAQLIREMRNYDLQTDRIVIEEVPIEEVEDFFCLGSVMSSNSSCDKEIKTRMGKANAVFGRLEKMWKSNGCSIDTKVRLYESIVLSTLLYGAETWPVTLANGRRLEAAHHRWLMRILHVTWVDKIPHKTIRERTRQEELGCIIRRKRLTWLGHVAIMNMNRKAKQVMSWTPGRKSGIGKPRKNWPV